MKKILFSIVIFTGLAAQADVYVNGYYRNNGTYVQPHYRTSPDSSVYNNYSTQGNINPYTGSYGTKSYDSYNYNSFHDQGFKQNQYNSNAWSY